MCGIGDYSWRLGQQLRTVNPGRPVRFLVTDPSNPLEPTCDGFQKHVVAPTDEAALRRELDAGGPSASVLLQYGQYDYDDRGHPRALIRALTNWRSASEDRRLGIMVHEIWLPSLVRRREWTIYPRQYLGARRLFRRADAVFVNNRRSAEKVLRLRGKAVDALLPVFSNFGEPALDPAALTARDPGQWVVFGSAGRILRSLRSFSTALSPSSSFSRSVTHLSVLGGKPSDEIRALLAALPFPSSYRPDLASDKLSAALLGETWSFMDYDDGLRTEPSLLFKSGVFAAMLAHGVIPVLAEDSGPLVIEGERLPGILSCPDIFSGLPHAERRNRLVLSNRDWYDKHISVRRHAEAATSFL